jgi:hypothetical protein
MYMVIIVKRFSSHPHRQVLRIPRVRVQIFTRIPVIYIEVLLCFLQ